MIRLSRGGFALDLLPEIGGGIARLTLDGVDVLRPAPAGAASPLDLASFPLVPFANRIAYGRFEFGGQEVRLAPNMGAHPHALHGQGWLAPWRVEACEAARTVLVFDHAGGEWPWAYRARQDIALTEAGLSLGLSVTNLSDAPMPAGLGFHPYFPGRAEARLTAALDGVWDVDADCLATGWQAGLSFGDWRAGAAVAQLGLIDHCHTGWDGRARIDLPQQGLVLRLNASRELSWLHLYSPPGEEFFCVEPVSHRPDALNASNPAKEGVRTLAPGAALAAQMRLNVAAR